MKKDRIRDYATAAFRDYAKRLNSGGDISASAAEDDEAVRKTLQYFKSEGKPYIVGAIEAVYFKGASEPLRICSISSRVKRYAFEQYADESTVYRWLKEARCKFAQYRGLTL